MTTSPNDPADILRRALDAASPRPWVRRDVDVNGVWSRTEFTAAGADPMGMEPLAARVDFSKRDADLLEAVVNHLGPLLDDYQRLRSGR